MQRRLSALVLGFALWTLAQPAAASAAVHDAPTFQQVPAALTESIMVFLADPNVAFLLLVLGVVGMVAEIYHPGTFVPGIVGMLALLLAFIGFRALPTNWGAVALIALAVLLFILELHLPSHGVLGISAVIAFLLGGFLLFASSVPPAADVVPVEVNPWLLVTASGGLAAFFLVAVGAGLRARRLPVYDPLTQLPGALGVATSPLAPTGTVRVQHATWSAVTAGGPIAPGEQVQVVSRDGLTLRVRPLSLAVSGDSNRWPSQGQVRPGLRVERTE